MATGDNAIHVLFDEADEVTCKTTGAVTAGHFVAVSADMEAQPALVVATPLVGGNNIKVAHCAAGARAFGVALTDIASGDPGTIKRTGIVQVVSSGTITAGAEVEVTTAGVALAFSSGIKVGLAVSTAAGNLVYVALYK